MTQRKRVAKAASLPTTEDYPAFKPLPLPKREGQPLVRRIYRPTFEVVMISKPETILPAWVYFTGPSDYTSIHRNPRRFPDVKSLTTGEPFVETVANPYTRLLKYTGDKHEQGTFNFYHSLSQVKMILLTITPEKQNSTGLVPIGKLQYIRTAKGKTASFSNIHVPFQNEAEHGGISYVKFASPSSTSELLNQLLGFVLQSRILAEIRSKQ